MTRTAGAGVECGELGHGLYFHFHLTESTDRAKRGDKFSRRYHRSTGKRSAGDCALTGERL